MQSGEEISYAKLMNAEVVQTIVFQLVVPTEREVEALGNKLDLSKSDLNACYSRPIVNPGNGKDQSWYDVKLTVQGDHNLPSEKEGFYVVTKRGGYFKALFSGKNTKKLVSLNDPRILGLIIKGALIDSKVFYEIDLTSEDTERKGIITKEVLREYGGSEVILKKTCITKEDKRGNKRDVGIISFPRKPWKPDEEGYKLVNEIANRNKD